MRFLTLTLLLSLLALTNAHRLEKRNRSSCFREAAARAYEENPNADATICYKGTNSATDEGSTETERVAGKYGYLYQSECYGVHLNCFWLKGPNKWRGYEDGGADNVAMWLKGNCKYTPEYVRVDCK